MHDYHRVKREHSAVIQRTLPDPVMVFDYLELKEAVFSVACFAYFGIVDVRPLLLIGILIFLLLIWPPIREGVPKGFLIHKINRFTPIKIPGFVGLGRVTKLLI